MSDVLLHHVECGPVSLLAGTPAQATVLTSLPGPDGDPQLCVQLATPVKHRLPSTAKDADHLSSQFGRDTHGPFLWVYYLALHPRVPGTDLAKPSADLPVDVSYILDPSIGQADVLDATKMVWVATAFLDHASGDVVSPLPSWPDLSGPEPDNDAADAESLSEMRFEFTIDRALGQLSAVARIWGKRALPRPRFQESLAVGPTGAAYTVEGDIIRSRSMSVHTGQPGTRGTSAAGELLYWIVDDAARALAWSFAYRSPAAASGVSADALKASVALPLWAAFVSALDPQWGVKTQATINALLHRAKPA